ncbi:MAG: response regulator transcription factor [Candidatus Eisenbacteria bacterium]|nr:response regulator transcription factor [Candidatus Eisenbacteria bacterium]
MRVLIADDDPTYRIFLEEALKKWGYEVEAVDDGEKAWSALCGSLPPRLVLLDWVMPGLDGVELIEKIRGEEKLASSYVILLTARDGKEDVVRGLDAGANDYITKPFHHAELRARVAVGDRVLGLQEQLAKRLRDLEGALAHVKTLQGLIPICMHCHKIRDDQESWQKIESYIEDHSAAEFSHSICPECLEKYYPPEIPEGESAPVGNATPNSD